MRGSIWVVIGEKAAGAYAAYAFFLLLGCLGLHFLLGVAYALARRRGSRRVLQLEIVYGLLNPLIYLLVFQTALFRSVTPGFLLALEWILLVGYWTWRLLARPARLVGSRVRGDRVLLAAAIALIVVVTTRDGTAWVSSQLIHDMRIPLVPLLVAPLYLFPFLITLFDLSVTRAAEGRGPPRRERLRLAAALAALPLTVAVSTLVHPSGAGVRRRVLELRPEIDAVAAEHRLDPRALAAIVYVQQRDHASPVRSVLEELSAGAWMFDDTSGLLLAEAFDPPLGPSRLKPITVMTALAVHALAGGLQTPPGKSYRQVPSGPLHDVPSPAIARLSPPLDPAYIPKSEVVRALLEPQKNLRLAAFVLDVLATDWDVKEPQVRIRSRPDLLATAFQLGFERAHPRAAPEPNAFGRQVQAAYDDWMAEHFDTPTP